MTARPSGWTSRPRSLLLALGLVLLLAAGGWAYGHSRSGASCQAWQRALQRRATADVALVGEATAQQFQREATASGRIDEAGRVLVRPAGCRGPGRP